MTIRYTKDALKFLSKLDKKTVGRIRAAIDGLTKTPPEGDIEPLQGSADGRKRLRVGAYRVIYKYDVDTGMNIEILLILYIWKSRRYLQINERCRNYVRNRNGSGTFAQSSA